MRACVQFMTAGLKIVRPDDRANNEWKSLHDADGTALDAGQDDNYGDVVNVKINVGHDVLDQKKRRRYCIINGPTTGNTAKNCSRLD
jgi:hypothetical protein